MLSDWLGMHVEVEEFAGAWLGLPVDQRTRIGVHGQFNRLAMDAAIGVRAWDPQARFVLRIGPLNRGGFERLLPDRLALHRLGVADPGLCRIRAGVRGEPGAGGARGAAAAA